MVLLCFVDVLEGVEDVRTAGSGFSKFAFAYLEHSTHT